MEWLRSVDLAEYAPNLRGSGVHGGLIVSGSLACFGINWAIQKLISQWPDINPSKKYW